MTTEALKTKNIKKLLKEDKLQKTKNAGRQQEQSYKKRKNVQEGKTPARNQNKQRKPGKELNSKNVPINHLTHKPSVVTTGKTRKSFKRKFQNEHVRTAEPQPKRKTSNNLGSKFKGVNGKKPKSMTNDYKPKNTSKQSKNLKKKGGNEIPKTKKRRQLANKCDKKRVTFENESKNESCNDRESEFTEFMNLLNDFDPSDSCYADYDNCYQDFDDSDLYYSETESDMDDDDLEFSYEKESLDSYNNFSFNSDNDSDYVPPENFVEDLVIHQGTATKWPLEAKDNVQFDSDIEELQIQEIVMESTVKTITQPMEYDREQLLKLNEKPLLKPLSKPSNNNRPVNFEDDESSDCPQLVPINDDIHSGSISLEDFDSVSSSYEACSESDDNSIISVDVNEKYLIRRNDDDDGEPVRKKMKADIIVVEGGTNQIEDFDNDGKINDQDEIIMANLPLENTTDDTVFESSIITATIMENFQQFPIVLPVENEEKTEENPNCDNNIDVNVDVDVNACLNLEQFPFISENSYLDTITSIFCSSFNKNTVLVLLKEPIHLYGTVKVIPVAGNIEIYGYVPKCCTEIEIFSPRGCNVVSIIPQANPSLKLEEISAIINELSLWFDGRKLIKILEKFSLENDSLILLKKNVERGKTIQIFKQYMNENIFPNMDTIHSSRPLYESESCLEAVINVKSCDKSLIIPSQWSTLTLKDESRVMVVGGKGVGKSTFIRYLINRNLVSVKFKRILLIDLDIGQPEIFVPQTISCTELDVPILGPGFFLNLQPNMSLFVGSTNAVVSSGLYIRAVRRLLQYCREKFSHLPWIINTMGYNKGFGIELIAAITKTLQPTDLVQLQSDKEVNNFDQILTSANLASVHGSLFLNDEDNYKSVNVGKLASYSLHLFNSAVPQSSRFQKEWDMGAKDMRYAILLSRLSAALQKDEYDWLLDVRPVRVCLDDIKILKTGTINEKLEDNTDVLKSALSSNLVYLCSSSMDATNDNLLQCIGIGIVRSVNLTLNEAYLIPAMPNNMLENVNTFVINEFPLPSSIFTNQGPCIQGKTPFLMVSNSGAVTKSVKQIYHRTPEFLNGNNRTSSYEN